MMSATRLRAARKLIRQLGTHRRPFSLTARQLTQLGGVTTDPETKTPSRATVAPPQVTETPPPVEVFQAPNRAEVWSRNQRPRSQAMTGPRFEQTDYDLQPQPYSAIELIHKEPVRWTHDRVVACDGGGASAGHPRIYINTDKPEIAVCGYCGIPFANEHHRKHLEALPETSYPL